MYTLTLTSATLTRRRPSWLAHWRSSPRTITPPFPRRSLLLWLRWKNQQQIAVLNTKMIKINTGTVVHMLIKILISRGLGGGWRKGGELGGHVGWHGWEKGRELGIITDSVIAHACNKFSTLENNKTILGFHVLKQRHCMDHCMSQKCQLCHH